MVGKAEVVDHISYIFVVSFATKLLVQPAGPTATPMLNGYYYIHLSTHVDTSPSDALCYYGNISEDLIDSLNLTRFWKIAKIFHPFATDYKFVSDYYFVLVFILTAIFSINTCMQYQLVHIIIGLKYLFLYVTGFEKSHLQHA